MTNLPGELPVGKPIADWTAPPRPGELTLRGRYCRLEPLDPDLHASQLYLANIKDQIDRNWVYLPYGPFHDEESYREWVRAVSAKEDPYFLAIHSRECRQFCGVASWLRIHPQRGSIEVGHINFSPLLQRTRAATEAMFLMMQWAFDAGYRRYEWKCDALNVSSIRAAERLGMSFEGVFRQATIYKGRNRDTAWFATIDSEWPRLRAAYIAWLKPENFDSQGRQRISLRTLTRGLLVKRYAD